MWQQAKNIYHLGVALLANLYYGFPGKKLTIIGVTGTSGKTTTTYMIYEILKAAGYRVSMLSSIKASIGGKDYDTGFHVTTPGRHKLAQYLKKAVDGGSTHFVLEISSHALDQNRAAFIPFKIGVLTTLAHEHLDYHKTFVNYAKAKFKLLHTAKKIVIPAHGIGDEVRAAVKFNSLKHKAVTFGISDADYDQEKYKLKLKMPGEFNLKNALAAIAVADLLGVKTDVIKRSLQNIVSLPGRFEEISTGKGFRVIIDFAHKPDALEGVLSVARAQVKKPGRVIVMFGAASERDTLKRPIMGEISGKMADITVLTDEDPRNESSTKIINEIAAGCEKNSKLKTQNSKVQLKSPHSVKASQGEQSSDHIFYKIPNRREAIEFIIKNLAQKEDIILLCGKGHETSMNYKGVETLWSEHEAVKKALK